MPANQPHGTLNTAGDTDGNLGLIVLQQWNSTLFVGRIYCHFCADVCGVIIVVLGLGSYSFSQNRVLGTNLFLFSFKFSFRVTKNKYTRVA